MKKSIISVHKQQSTVSQILVIVLFICLMFFIDDFLSELLWYVSIVVDFSIIFLLYFLIDFGTEIRIQNSILMSGKYHRLTGFFKPINDIPIDEITEIDLWKTEKNYFQITAFSKNKKIVIKELPNRYPAQIELEKIKAIIKKDVLQP